jgi:hypothetical protein
MFEIYSACRAEDWLALMEKSLEERHPYPLAFVDVRMAPDWNRVERTSKIWGKYCDLQVVFEHRMLIIPGRNGDTIRPVQRELSDRWADSHVLYGKQSSTPAAKDRF